MPEKALVGTTVKVLLSVYLVSAVTVGLLWVFTGMATAGIIALILWSLGMLVIGLYAVWSI